MNLITKTEDLPQALRESINTEETAFINTLKDKGLLPFAVTPFYASLARPERDDPIRKLCIPDPREAYISPFETIDPLGASRYEVCPRMVHQYRDRVLLLTNGACAGYCRHCFRRNWIARPEGFISEKELSSVLDYLQNNTEVHEILLSGGDLLTASDDKIFWLLSKLKEAGSRIFGRTLLLRIGSRVPVTNPERITPELVEMLSRFKPLCLVLHLNHPRELAPEVRQALEMFVQAGIPLHTQTVLLKGINDDVETLACLFRESLNLGINPYYLLQGDLAPGTRHLRVNLQRGIELYKELKSHISGLGYPHYALDLPGGGGKIMLHEGSILTQRDSPRGKVYVLHDAQGREYEYPVEKIDGL
ncbi:MAG: KamA family radical SAM protein [Treponema sp.]|jgi:lysine 2,3-aminomutase|nr:KamA family radical SAM protein [Treponema sp.]